MKKHIERNHDLENANVFIRKDGDVETIVVSDGDSVTIYTYKSGRKVAHLELESGDPNPKSNTGKWDVA